MLKKYKNLWIALLILMLLSPLGLIARGTAFGEWSPEELRDQIGYIPSGLAHWAGTWTHAVLPDYSLPGSSQSWLASAGGYVLSAVVGVLMVVGIIALFYKILDD